MSIRPGLLPGCWRWMSLCRVRQSAPLPVCTPCGERTGRDEGLPRATLGNTLALSHLHPQRLADSGRACEGGFLLCAVTSAGRRLVSRACIIKEARPWARSPAPRTGSTFLLSLIHI